MFFNGDDVKRKRTFAASAEKIYLFVLWSNNGFLVDHMA